MSKIKLSSNASGTGNVTVISPATNSDRTITLPDGDGALPLMKLETAVTASGTSVDFTSIPSWVKRITVMFSGVSTSGTSQPYLQIGDAGGIESAAYLNFVASVSTAANTTSGSLSITAAFPLYTGATVALASMNGALTLSKLNSNIWVISGVLLSGQRGVMLGGSKELSDTLTQVRITTANGTDTFDAGTINIMLEG